MNTADDVRAHARAMVAEIETYRDPTECELRAAKLIDRLEARIAQLERALARKGLVADANARDAQLAEQRVRELEEARVRELEMAIVRWYEASGDCECREVHFLNLCPTCASEEVLADIARAAKLRKE